MIGEFLSMPFIYFEIERIENVLQDEISLTNLSNWLFAVKFWRHRS